MESIYVSRTIEDAYLLKNLLEERGIPTAVFNACLQGGMPVELWAWEWTMLPRVVVNVENAAAARRMALDFDQSITGRALAVADESGQGVKDGNGGKTTDQVPQ